MAEKKKDSILILDNATKKLIVNTVAITLSFLIVATIAFLVVFYSFFPIRAADFSYELGMYGTASQLYYRDYQKSGNIKSLHNSLVLASSSNDYAKVEVLFEELSSNEIYGTFISQLNKQNYNLQINSVIKSTIINEDNYLKQIYVDALIKQQKFEKACKFTISNFSSSVTLTHQKAYMLSPFFSLKVADLNVFFAKFIGEKNLFQYLVDYYYIIYDVFYTAVTPQVNMTQLPYLLSLGNRISLVANHIIYLENKITHSVDVDVAQISDYAHFVDTMLSEII